jgi:pimeloyl-ACP methyl ester carboxylesterase
MKVRSGEVELAVRTWGARSAPPVVLVHGYPDRSEVWTPIAERLAARHRVIAYDVRGAGGSTAPRETAAYALAYLAGDLRAVVDATCDRPVHLVGHDWGSIQAWEAVTDPALAERFASFTSISGPCLDHVGIWLREASLGERLRQARRSWYIAALQLPGVPSLAWRAGIGRRIVPHARTRDGVRGAALYRANVGERLRHPRERRTDVPVRLIVPTRDPYVSRPLVDQVARWAPRLERREIDAGHWVVRSHPDELAAWIGRGASPHA